MSVLGRDSEVTLVPSGDNPEAAGARARRAPASLRVARHRLRVPSLERGRGAPRWNDPEYTEWSAMVGDRVRRLRLARDLTLVQLAAIVERAAHGSYSPGYLSRLERGYATAPLRAYLEIAVALEVAPGRLLGSDELEREVSEAEMTLISLIRRLELAPDEAIARLVGP